MILPLTVLLALVSLGGLALHHLDLSGGPTMIALTIVYALYWSIQVPAYYRTDPRSANDPNWHYRILKGASGGVLLLGIPYYAVLAGVLTGLGYAIMDTPLLATYTQLMRDAIPHAAVATMVTATYLYIQLPNLGRQLDNS